MGQKYPDPFLGLGPNMIASPQRPSLMPPLGPFGQVISISSHPPPPSGPNPSPINRSPRNGDLARHSSFSVAQQTLGNIDSEHMC